MQNSQLGEVGLAMKGKKSVWSGLATTHQVAIDSLKADVLKKKRNEAAHTTKRRPATSSSTEPHMEVAVN